MENIISNFKTKIKCPKCNSQNIYKFGKDPKTGNQKYQCKDCKHQGTFLDPVNRESKKGYPRCPLCGKGSYLHHDYKYYSNFTCNDKSCKHSFYIVKPTAVDDASSSTLFR